METEELLKDDVSITDIIDRHPDKLSELVKNEEFKAKLYKHIEEKGFSWPMMRDLVSSVGEKDIIDNLDVSKMVESSNISHKESSYICIAALMENGDSALIDRVLENDTLASTFYDNIDRYSGFLEDIDVKKRKELFEKAYQKDSSSDVVYKITKTLDDNTKKELLNGDYDINVTKSVINSSSLEVVQDYIDNNPKALTTYKDLGVLRLAKKGVVFPKDITRRDEFFEEIKSNDMVEFRKNVNLVTKESSSYYLMNKVKMYEENILDSFNEEKGIFEKYDFENEEMLKNALDADGKDYVLNYEAQAEANKFNELKTKLNRANTLLREKYNLNIDISNLDERELENIKDPSLKEQILSAKEDYHNSYNQIQNSLKEISAENYGPMLSDYTFSDTKNDVETNTYELLHYNDKLPEDKKLLNKEKEDLYSKFNNLDTLSASEQHKLYKETKDKNMTGELYTDISRAKKDIYKDICDSLYDPDKQIDDISIDDSEKTGTEYHKLDGQEFYMLVRTLNTPFKEKTKNPQSCYTLISNKNLNVFDGKYVYYYGKVDPNTIINTYESDSFTNAEKDNVTDRANRLSTKEDLVETSASYSEVNLMNKKMVDENGKEYYEELKPTGLVSFGEPDRDTLEENKRINGKFTQIEKERYKQEIRPEDAKEDKRYDYDINPNER